MLMLQRAAENVNPSECNDPAVLLACSLGSDSCPAACQKKADEKADEPATSNINDMPVAGDLTVAVADYSSEVRSVPANGTVVFNAVDFKASEKIVIESVKLERLGLSDKSNIAGVWFEKDGVAVSSKASVSSDGTITTRFYNNFSVNGTETLDLVVELKWETTGAEIAFQIIGVTSTAKNVSVNTKSSTYRTTAYTVSTVKFEMNGTAGVTEYKVGESKSFEIWRFQLTTKKGGAEDRDVIVKSIKLRNASGLNLAETFKNVYVTRDSKTVSKSVTLDGKDMTITFDDDVIESGKKGIYYIMAEVAQLNEVNKSVQLQLRKSSELVANEKTTNFRTSYQLAKNETFTEVNLKTYTFKWGKVTFTNNSSMAKTVNAAASATDVVIAKGTLTISEPVKLPKIKITSTGNKYLANAKDCEIKNVKIEIGGSTYDTEVASLTDEWCNTFTTVDSDIYVSKTSDIRVLVSVDALANSNDTISFGLLNGQSFVGNGTYDNSDEPLTLSDIAWSIQLAKVTVKAGKFNITNKKSSTQKVVVNSSEDVIIFDWEITSKEDRVSINDLVLSGFYKIDKDVVITPAVTESAEGTCSTTSTTQTDIDAAAAATTKTACLAVNSSTWTPTTAAQSAVMWTNYYGLDQWEQISLTLYVNGEPYSDTVFRQGRYKADPDEVTYQTAKFSNLWDVEAGKSMKIQIKAQPTIGTMWQITFSVKASGSDSNGNPVEATPISASRIEVTGAASATIANSDAKSSVVKDGSNETLATFDATVKNGTLNLTKVKVKVTEVASSNVLGANSVTLAIDGQDSESTTLSEGFLVFDVNENLNIGNHTFALKANLNANANPSKSTLVIDNVALYQDWKDSPITNGTKELNITKLVAKAYPVLSAKKDWEDLVVTIQNPSSNEYNISVKKLAVNWKVVTASLAGTPLKVAGNKIKLSDDEKSFIDTAETPNSVIETVAPGKSIEFKVQVEAGETITVDSITIDADDQLDMLIDSKYKNVADWTSLKITSSRDKKSS